jgi:hypothetical protein
MQFEQAARRNTPLSPGVDAEIPALLKGAAGRQLNPSSLHSHADDASGVANPNRAACLWIGRPLFALSFALSFDYPSL